MRKFQTAQGNDHIFQSNISLESIIDIYEFDRKLKLIIFDLIERFEIAFRTVLSYQNSILEDNDKGGYRQWWYENPILFINTFEHTEHLKNLDFSILRSKKQDPVIKNYLDKYLQPQRPPSWMAFETLSFGLLSKFHANLRSSHNGKKQVANYFGLKDPEILASWVHGISQLRNICAHHGGLWNRPLPISIKHPGTSTIHAWPTIDVKNKRLYPILCALLYLMNQAWPEENWTVKIKTFILSSTNIDSYTLGFTPGWENEDFWR